MDIEDLQPTKTIGIVKSSTSFMLAESGQLVSNRQLRLIRRLFALLFTVEFSTKKKLELDIRVVWNMANDESILVRLEDDIHNFPALNTVFLSNKVCYHSSQESGPFLSLILCWCLFWRVRTLRESWGRILSANPPKLKAKANMDNPML